MRVIDAEPVQQLQLPTAPSGGAGGGAGTSRDAKGYLQLVKPVSSQYICAFVKAMGNIPLAAEDLGMEPSELAMELAEDIPALNKAIRAVALMQVFETTTIANKVLIASLSMMKPEDIVKSWLGGLQNLERLTGESAIVQQNNYNQLNVSGQGNGGGAEMAILRALPEKAQSAVMALINRPEQSDN